MSESSDVWFYAKGAEKFGPFPRAHLVALAKEGGLDPRLDLIWRPGMGDWLPAGEVEGLFEKREPELVAEPAAAAAPTGGGVWADMPDYGDAPVPRAKYPGTGRFGYFFGTMIGLPLLAVGFGFALPTLNGLVGQSYAGWLPVVFAGLMCLLALGIVLGRLGNLGMSGWWLLGLLAPILNLWLGYRLTACPPGYAAAKKMDGIGIVLAILYWLFLAASAALVIFAAVTGFAELKDSGEWRELLEKLPQGKGG